MTQSWSECWTGSVSDAVEALLNSIWAHYHHMTIICFLDYGCMQLGISRNCNYIIRTQIMFIAF